MTFFLNGKLRISLFLPHLDLNGERKDKGGDISETSGQLACVF